MNMAFHLTKHQIAIFNFHHAQILRENEREIMNTYRIDFINNDVKITESNRPFDNKEGMSFTLPNNTHIFFTHNFIHEMNERIDDIKADYEDERISDSLPNYYEES